MEELVEEKGQVVSRLKEKSQVLFVSISRILSEITRN